MELKSHEGNQTAHDIDSFNRTFMELKFRQCGITNIAILGFNRTFMELKSRYQAAPLCFPLF